MRKVQLLLACLVFSVAAFAADKVIKLPKPNLNRTGTVMKALSERHSTREFASKALNLSDLSDLLWAANGINRSALPSRPEIPYPYDRYTSHHNVRIHDL